MLKEGDAMPSFQARDADGNMVKSSEQAGKRLVIYFYPKDFTSGCTTEAGEFAKEYKRFAEAKVDVIGISPDGVESHKKFCDKMKIPYTLLADTDKKISKSFGVWGTKKFMGREYMGVIRSTFLVDERGKIFKVYGKVRPAGHPSQVLKDMK